MQSSKVKKYFAPTGTEIFMFKHDVGVHMVGSVGDVLCDTVRRGRKGGLALKDHVGDGCRVSFVKFSFFFVFFFVLRPWTPDFC